MADLPQYKQIYEDLRAQIANGTYTPGDMLPSEYALCTIHAVARMTVRKALSLLASDGLIIRRQGRGSIVKGTPKGVGILSLIGTTSALKQSDLTTRIVYQPELRTWKEAFSFPIEAEEEAAGCIYFERLRLIDGIPVFFDITMLPDMDLPRFREHKLENRSLFDLLRKHYEIVVTGGTQQLFAIRADKRLRENLNVGTGHPVLQLNRKIETNRDGFHIYSQLFCDTQHYGLTGTF
ncbi:MAG: GntR family transcriptional regulator [Tannerella sp.]|nr:GntR family transcriptional regulator [Tannerella sp.]